VGEATKTPHDQRLLHRLNPIMRCRAARLRKEAPQPERALWYWLRKSQLDGWKFRRQATIGSFIVDFLCPELELVIELDGESHIGTGFRDQSRDSKLIGQGYRVLRFTNDDVLTNIEGVLMAVRNAPADLHAKRISRKPPTP